MPHERALKWIRQDLYILLVEFIEQAIFDAASKSSSEPASKSSLLSSTAEERLKMKCASARFLACEKDGSHLNAYSSESKGCHDAPCVSNSARGDDGVLHGIDDLRHQRHCSRQRIFGWLQKGAAMPAASKPEATITSTPACSKA